MVLSAVSLLHFSSFYLSFARHPLTPPKQPLPRPGPDHIHMLIISLNQLHHIYEEILRRVIIGLIKTSTDASPALLVLPLRLFFTTFRANIWPDPAGTDVFYPARNRCSI